MVCQWIIAGKFEGEADRTQTGYKSRLTSDVTIP